MDYIYSFATLITIRNWWKRGIHICSKSSCDVEYIKGCTCNELRTVVAVSLHKNNMLCSYTLVFINVFGYTSCSIDGFSEVLNLEKMTVDIFLFWNYFTHYRYGENWKSGTEEPLVSEKKIQICEWPKGTWKSEKMFYHKGWNGILWLNSFWKTSSLEFLVIPPQNENK